MKPTTIPWTDKGEIERPIPGPKEQSPAAQDQPAVVKPKQAFRPVQARPDAAKPAPKALDLGCL